MTPTEAVVLRTQIAEGHSRLLAKKGASIADSRVRAMAAIEGRTLHNASLFTWRTDLLRAAISAAELLPSPVTLKHDLMPVESGLYLFDDSVTFTGCSKPISAFSWCPLASDYTAFFLYISTFGTTWADIGPMAAFANFVFKNDSNVDVAATAGADWREKTTNSEFDMKPASEAALRFLFASWLWLKQSVMSSEPAVIQRHAAKMADRACVMRAVNVVVLRRRDVSTRPSSDTDREYGCQWLVRGHWRQQFYPSTSEHRPLWIEPYVKGPEDKPFKPPSETVFAVQR